MNDGFEAVYRKMRDASQEELSTMLSESTYKKAILQLIGDDMPIYELGLSTRSHNSLRRAGYHTLSSLLSCSDEQMNSIKNLGKKQVAEVYEKLYSIVSELAEANLTPGETSDEAENDVHDSELDLHEADELHIFRKGSELFSVPKYRSSIIRFFELKDDQAELAARSLGITAQRLLFSRS